MSDALWLVVVIVGLVVLFAMVIAMVPALTARAELRRVRGLYNLSDDEAEVYARELPEVCHAVADSLEAPRSGREIRRIASDSVINSILVERRRRARGQAGPAAEAAREAELDRLERSQPGAVTREDLGRSRPQR